MRDRPPPGDYVPYSLRTVCGFFNVPQNLYMQGLWDGAYGLSSLSEKTRKSNRLQMLLQRQHFLLSYLKTLSVGPAGTWTNGLPLGRLALSLRMSTRNFWRCILYCFCPSDLQYSFVFKTPIGKYGSCKVMCIMFRDESIIGFFKFPFPGGFSLHLHKRKKQETLLELWTFNEFIETH